MTQPNRTREQLEAEARHERELSNAFDTAMAMIDRRISTLTIGDVLEANHPTLTRDEITKVIGLAWGP